MKNNSNPKEKKSFWHLILKHSTASVLIISLLALCTIYIWKEFENKRQNTVIIKAATLQIENNQQELLKVIAKPLVWDIRSEMLRGNLEQADLLISDLVKEKKLHLHPPYCTEWNRNLIDR